MGKPVEPLGILRTWPAITWFLGLRDRRTVRRHGYPVYASPGGGVWAYEHELRAHQERLRCTMPHDAAQCAMCRAGA